MISSRRFETGGPKAPDEKSWLTLLEGDQPVLILLDEMPPYFHYLDTQKVGGGTVADIATRAFANLLTAAGKKKNVWAVVRTLLRRPTLARGLINRALEDARSELGLPGADHHHSRRSCGERDLRHPTQAPLHVTA